MIKLILEGLSDLPIDLILKIFSLLEDTLLIKEFFLYWPKTRQIVIENYYANDLHCIVTPFLRQNHVCIDGSGGIEVYDLKYFGEIDEFLLLNPDITPRNLIILSGIDFVSLFEIFEKYKARFLTSERLQLLVEGRTQIDLNNLKFIIDSKNLYRLQLTGFDFKVINKIILEILPTLEKLKVIQFLGHNVNDWSKFLWPPNLTSLDLSWNKYVDVLTINFPDTLIELYLNMSNITSNNLLQLYDRFPHDIKTVMLSYNSIEQLYANKLPNSIELLDVLFNKIKYLIDSGSTIFPEGLRELNLSSNYISNNSLIPLQDKIWPQNLKVVNLSGNRITDLYLLKLPDSVERLQLDVNDIYFKVEGNHIIPYKWPQNLKYLLFFKSDIMKQIRTLPHLQNHIEFPPYLKHLSIIECNLDTLQPFKFPKLLMELEIQDNKISTPLSYEFNWSDLVNLERMTVDMTIDLDPWDLPPNLKIIDRIAVD